MALRTGNSVVLGLVISLFALASGCKPKLGGRCSPGQTACQDGHAALYCDDGKQSDAGASISGPAFAEMTCSGPDGCVQSGKQVDCDNTIANKGDGCSEPEDLACTADKKGELRCRGGHFALASTCRGPSGCFFTGNKLHCDSDLADTNDPCEDKDDLACSLDKKALYKCDGQQYQLDSTCRGPKGCVIEGNNVNCDHHVAEVTDLCRFEGSYACTSDKKALLACRGGKFKLEKKCNKPCAFTDRSDQTEFDCP